MPIRSSHFWRLVAQRLAIGLILLSPSLFATTVTTSGRQLLVNGQPYTVKGVDYSPIPVGYTVGAVGTNCLGPYQWWTDRVTYVADFPQIHRLGANTIRTYDILNSTATSKQVLQMLDTAQANGLYVIMGYFVSHTQDLTIASFQTQTLAAFVAAVNAYKNHPAVLMWAFGNENNLDNGNTNPAWYSLIEQAAQQAKATDPFHAVTTVEGECIGSDCFDPFAPGDTYLNDIGKASIGANDASLPFLDVWSINSYRGKTFEGVFQALAVSTMTTKPVLISEFGKDAWHDATASEDQDTQATYINSQWLQINANLSATSSGSANLVGGLVFEWSDEWWKDTTDDCQTHGTQIIFHRTDDTVDPNYQDEWFGITSVAPINAFTNPNGTIRTERKAYAALQAFWNPSGLSATSAVNNFFIDTVRNFPNPFQVGISPTRFVALVNEAGSVDIRIYDASGRFVTGLPVLAATGPGRYEVTWDGHNRQGEYVSPGLYYARIEGKGASHSDHQFRRVVAVK